MTSAVGPGLRLHVTTCCLSFRCCVCIQLNIRVHRAGQCGPSVGNGTSPLKHSEQKCIGTVLLDSCLLLGRNACGKSDPVCSGPALEMENPKCLGSVDQHMPTSGIAAVESEADKCSSLPQKRNNSPRVQVEDEPSSPSSLPSEKWVLFWVSDTLLCVCSALRPRRALGLLENWVPKAALGSPARTETLLSQEDDFYLFWGWVCLFVLVLIFETG